MLSLLRAVLPRQAPAQGFSTDCPPFGPRDLSLLQLDVENLSVHPQVIAEHLFAHELGLCVRHGKKRLENKKGRHSPEPLSRDPRGRLPQQACALPGGRMCWEGSLLHRPPPGVTEQKQASRSWIDGSFLQVNRLYGNSASSQRLFLRDCTPRLPARVKTPTSRPFHSRPGGGI